MTDLQYQSGFGNEFASEALPGALPAKGNNPQRCPYGLFAEQLTGSSFLAPRGENKRSWLYKIRPSVVQTSFEKMQANGQFLSAPFADVLLTPNQLRWSPLPVAVKKTDFIDGITTFCVNGSVVERQGSAVHLYACNQSMQDRCFYNADGDMLIVLQEGSLRFQTEFGFLEAKPGEIVHIARGMKFRVLLGGKTASGYICENYGRAFDLPPRGAIGANGLANERDFLAPVAAYEESSSPMQLVAKFQGELWTAKLPGSAFDVVAWHGNYYPYKYDLSLFNTINTVSFDHPDPSIFTVLSSPTTQAGTSNVDFVIFPPRWMVAENTFRPPYFHRNTMSEYMGLIHGVYDAKLGEDGFVPGGGSLHNCMSPHGPDEHAFKAASTKDLKPEYLGDTLAFMFESSLVYQPTQVAMKGGLLQEDYQACWQGLQPGFSPDKP